MKEQILALRAEGKNYNEIKSILNCSKSTISYHCGEGQKEKSSVRSRKTRINKPLQIKMYRFLSEALRNKSKNFSRTNKNECDKLNFTVQELFEKITKNPICYLTGRKIDIYKPSSYHFDHIIPVSKGGNNSLDNLGIACKEANMAKNDLLKEDFLQLCKDVIKHNRHLQKH